MKKPIRRQKITLGVNIDHAATLRQVRGGTTPYPELPEIAREALRGGAQQITIHLREDRRHIQEQDVWDLVQTIPVPINLEMAADPWMVRFACQTRPDWVCFVPEKRAELTTEGGLNVLRDKRKISQFVQKLQFVGIECSMFIDPNLDQVRASFAVGADAIELHTGTWVLSHGRARSLEWKRLVRAAELAHRLGMRVHAGHGLDFETAKEIRFLPHLVEVNIGHSLICSALTTGLRQAVRKMRSCL